MKRINIIITVLEHERAYTMKKYLIILFCSALMTFAVEAAMKPKLIVASVPKSGTHLLEKLIPSITGQHSMWASRYTEVNPAELHWSIAKGLYYNTHAPCVQATARVATNNDCKVILLIRDPRDVLVSYAHWIKKNPDHNILWIDQKKLDRSLYKKWSVNEIITHLIENFECKAPNIPGNHDIVSFYNLYLPWKDYPKTFVTTFEKLVGARGGGEPGSQEREIGKLAEFLGASLTEAQIRKICATVFGGTPTFRSGKIGSWKEHFSLEQKEKLKQLNGFNEMLITLEYEVDDNW